MTVDDRTRLQLHHKLEAVLGTEEANTLMAHLPPVTWNDVATNDDIRSLKDDLHAVESVIRSDMRAEFAGVRTEIADLRGEMHTEFAGVRTEIADLRGEMHTEIAGVRTEIADLRGEMHTGFAGVRTEMADLRGEMQAEIAGIRGEMHAEIAGIRGEIHKAVSDQTKWMVGFICGWSAIVLAFARIVL